MLRCLFSALVLVAATAAFAGQEGYIKNGKEYIVYKDGEKIGDWPLAPPAPPTNGKIQLTASTPWSASSVLYFIDDTAVNIRCYALTRAPGYATSEPLSCARTQ